MFQGVDRACGIAGRFALSILEVDPRRATAFAPWGDRRTDILAQTVSAPDLKVETYCSAIPKAAIVGAATLPWFHA